MSLRKLRKNALYAVLTTAGLSFGILVFLSGIHWASWHLSFDRHVPGREQVYRLSFEEESGDFYRHTARVLHGDVLNRILFSESVPEIEDFCRLAPFRRAVLRVGDEKHYEDYAFSTDPGFFQIFRPEVLHGPPTKLLTGSNEAVITLSTAMKLFGRPDPVGESIALLHQFDYDAEYFTVQAVITDFPPNSHMKITVLTSFANPLEFEGTSWTYVRQSKGSEAAVTERKLKEYLELSRQDENEEYLHPRLQALDQIHLHSHKAREMMPGIALRTVVVLILTAALVFILAWFNFSLLTFSRNQLNFQQLLVKWQMGGSRRDFFREFFCDHLVQAIAGFLGGLVLTLLLFPYLKQLGGSAAFHSPRLMLASAVLVLMLVLGSAALTALLSTERLYVYLQLRYLNRKIGKMPEITRRQVLVRGVIVLEFAITFVLVFNLFMINRQTSFAMAQQLGATQPESIHLPNQHRHVIDNFSLFKQKVMESPHVAMVSGSTVEPGGQIMDASGFEIEGIDVAGQKLFLFPVDENFFRFYDMEILHGLDMPESYDPDDSTESFYLNETAARMIGMDPTSLIGRELKINFSYPGLIGPGRVRGIVRDFHLSGMDYALSPMVIFPKYTWIYCFSLLPAGEPEAALSDLESTWEELFPDFPLEYVYAEDLIGELYANEIRQGRILLFFALVSLLIAGMGLFALSGLFMEKRTKSAALRKINGAGIFCVLIPEFRYYLWLVLLSSVLSAGPALLLARRWMQQFEYRCDVPVWIFPLCIVVLLIFSWIAVLYHSIRLARTNPLEFIREQ